MALNILYLSPPLLITNYNSLSGGRCCINVPFICDRHFSWFPLHVGPLWTKFSAFCMPIKNLLDCDKITQLSECAHLHYFINGWQKSYTYLRVICTHMSWHKAWQRTNLSKQSNLRKRLSNRYRLHFGLIFGKGGRDGMGRAIIWPLCNPPTFLPCSLTYQ